MKITIQQCFGLGLMFGILGITLPSQAATITDGFTFSVAAFDSTGSHYHSSTGGDFGNPVGKSEVGNFFSEEVRGLSEYDLTLLQKRSSHSMFSMTEDYFLVRTIFLSLVILTL